MSRRSIEGTGFAACFVDPQPMINALLGARGNEFAALRYDAQLKRLAGLIREARRTRQKGGARA